MNQVGQVALGLVLDKSSFNKDVVQSANFAENTFKSTFKKIGIMMGGVFALTKMKDFTKSCITLSSDLNEVQNVVNKAFPSMVGNVEEFSKTAIDNFGLSELAAKKMMGTYGNMARSFGFSEKQAYRMAESLTGLSGDVASFYNLDPTEAYNKLKSVFTGETETLKELGVVMTQNALDQYALANGFGRTTAQMSEQEKTSLRLMFVQNSLATASGDFASTSDSWANKVRVLTLNFESLKAALGSSFIAILSPIVGFLNMIIVKLTQAAKYLAAFINLLTGKGISASTESASKNVSSLANGIGSAGSGASNLAKGMNSVGSNAKKAAKEMGKLAGFDDIKNISAPSTQGGGSGSSGGAPIGGGMNLGSMNEMMNIPEPDIGGVASAVEKVKKAFGDMSKFIKDNEGIILGSIATIVGGFATFKAIQFGSVLSAQFSVLNGVMSAWQLSLGQTIQVLLGVTGPVMLIVAALGILSGAIVYLYDTNESFRNLVQESLTVLMELLQQFYDTVLMPLFTLLTDIFNTIIVPLAEFIGKVIVKNVEIVMTLLMEFWKNVLAPIADFLIQVLAAAIEGVIEVWESWKPYIEMIFDALNDIWDNVLSPLADWIVDVFVGAFETFGKFIEDLIPNVVGIFQGLIDFFVGIFTLDMEKAWEGICGVFTNAWETITNIFSPIIDWFTNIFSSAWESVKNVFSNWGAFFQSLWDKISSTFSDLGTSIANAISGALKAGINGIIGSIENIINGGIDLINGAINLINKIPGVNIGKMGRLNLPRLAQGGYVEANTPQLAMIGDNKRYGEIVTPENKMFEVMTNALKAFEGKRGTSIQDIDVLVAILYEILEVIKNKHFNIDGDEMNDNNNQKDTERALRTGGFVY